MNSASVHCSWVPQITLFCNFFITNCKYYFIIVFTVSIFNFNKNKLYPHGPIKSANAQTVICYRAFGLFNPYYSSTFLCFFFRRFCFCFLSFLLFLLNIYYLNMHIQLHRLNKFLQYFHNYLTIYTVHWPLFSFFFFHNTPGFACALFVFFFFKYLYVHT